MAGQIDIVVTKQAQKELDNLLANLRLTYDELVKINKEAINFNNRPAPRNPTDALEATRRLNEQYLAQQRTITQLEAQIRRLSNARQASNQRTSEEIVNQRALAQNADRQARATSALVGAYANLNAQHQIASTRLQNLIARGQTATQTQREYNRELREAQRDFDRLNQRVLSADRAVGRFNRNVGNYPRQAIAGIRDLIGAFGIVGGVSLFAGIATDIFRTTKELQSLDNALKQVTGTQEQFARSQAFLREISEDYGIEINGLTTQFTQFYVSAKDKLSGTEIENIFRSISKAGATMGLSVDAQNRAFTALNQMMSKGVVSAEELRGQLGEALPGAFGIMAKAMGTTEVGLAKLMKDGKVLANEVLPKFAQELEKVYGIETIDRVDTLAASQNRLSNSWTELIRSLNESETGGISSFFKTMVDGLNSVLELITQANKSFDDFKKQAYKENKSNKALHVEQMADDEAKAIIAGQIKRGKTPYDFEELKRIKLIEIATNELTRQKANYIQALKDEEGAEIALNIQKEKSESLITGGIFNLLNLSRAEKKHQDAVLKTQEIRGNIDGLMLVLNKKEEQNTKAVTENTKATTKSTKAVIEKKKAYSDARLALVGTVEWFEILKKSLEEEQRQVSQTSEKWQDYQKRIDQVQKSIDAITKSTKELDGISLDLGGSEFITDEDGDALMKAGDELRALLKEFKQGFIDDFADQSGFSGIIDIMSGGLDKFEGDAVSTALAVSEAFQQAFNTISQMSQTNYENMYRNLEQQRDVAILFAGESTTAREEIERQYEERRRRIQRQQAESQKKLAIFNAVINTAQAVTAALANYDYVSAILFGILGAAQVAMISAQPVPAFEKGGIHDGGLMLVNDGKGSNYEEKVVTPDGKVIEPKGRNVLMNAPKGTKIFTHDQWQDQMNNILLGNGITPMQVNNYQGLTKSDLEDVMSRNLNRDSYHFNIDENGIKKTIMRGTAQTTILNSRLRIKSKDV